MGVRANISASEFPKQGALAGKEAGYLWELGVPAGVVSLILGVVIERAIERKYMTGIGQQ